MNKYMRMALNEARKGIKAGHGGPFGAVIVKDGVVVAKGHNQVVKNVHGGHFMGQYRESVLWM